MKRGIPFVLLFAAGCFGRRPTAPAPAPLAETPLLSLFADTRASRVGDLVTVQIMETSKGSRRVTSRADKDGELSVDLKTNTGGKAARSSMGLKTTNDTNAESGLERRGSLIA
ncbi:MAG TPA: flagellar basal body L-ring protein FlgH, partial [Elusimicrobiota bacterium]|nr:flagellar basal body L-ring protein FlgH [Elusimicrobiota bacterium]